MHYINIKFSFENDLFLTYRQILNLFPIILQKLCKQPFNYNEEITQENFSLIIQGSQQEIFSILASILKILKFELPLSSISGEQEFLAELKLALDLASMVLKISCEAAIYPQDLDFETIDNKFKTILAKIANALEGHLEIANG